MCTHAPVRLNWRVHIHFPDAVHLGQSDASQLVSVQLIERKISLWLILQSCSVEQFTELLIQAPSGQLVHHLHCRLLYVYKRRREKMWKNAYTLATTCLKKKCLRSKDEYDAMNMTSFNFLIFTSRCVKLAFLFIFLFEPIHSSCD